MHPNNTSTDRKGHGNGGNRKLSELPDTYEMHKF